MEDSFNMLSECLFFLSYPVLFSYSTIMHEPTIITADIISNKLNVNKPYYYPNRNKLLPCCCTVWHSVHHPCSSLWFLPCRSIQRYWIPSFCIHHRLHYYTPQLLLKPWKSEINHNQCLYHQWPWKRARERLRDRPGIYTWGNIIISRQNAKNYRATFLYVNCLLTWLDVSMATMFWPSVLPKFKKMNMTSFQHAGYDNNIDMWLSLKETFLNALHNRSFITLGDT